MAENQTELDVQFVSVFLFWLQMMFFDRSYVSDVSCIIYIS